MFQCRDLYRQHCLYFPEFIVYFPSIEAKKNTIYIVCFFYRWLNMFCKVSLLLASVFRSYAISRNNILLRQKEFKIGYRSARREHSYTSIATTRFKFLLITNLTQFFMYLFIYFISLHVSSIKCSSSGDRIVLIHHLV